MRASPGADQFGKAKMASAHPEVDLWLTGVFEFRVGCGRIQGACREGPLVFSRPRVHMLPNFPSFSHQEWSPRFSFRTAGFHMESLVARCVDRMFLVFSLCLDVGGNGGRRGAAGEGGQQHVQSVVRGDL